MDYYYKNISLVCILLLIIGCKDQKPTKLSEEIEEVSHMNKFEWRPTECAPE
ncbi:DUF2931 family protein, partial [Cellulophaga sp. E16_2]|nr:DUF2931 family protein [Cellulophaga sp. E16_2]